MASLITSLTIVYSIVNSDADQRKHQSTASLAFVRGIHRWPVNSPHKWPVTRKMFPFDDVIMACNLLRYPLCLALILEINHPNKTHTNSLSGVIGFYLQFQGPNYGGRTWALSLHGKAWESIIGYGANKSQSILRSCFIILRHDDVIKWKHFPRYWPFVRGIHRSSVNSPHKGQWRGALIFSLICVWINDWVNDREAGDSWRYCAHNDVIIMMYFMYWSECRREL